MSDPMNWAAGAYYVVAFFSVLLLAVVMVQASANHHLNRNTTLTVRTARTVAFGIAMFYLCMSAIFLHRWEDSPILAILVMTGSNLGGSIILAVNVISLNQQKPNSGYKARNYSPSRLLARVTSYFIWH